MTIPTIARAPRFLGATKIEWQDRPVPRPGEGELLLRVQANAICGTDREQFHDGSDVIPGHEAAGEVLLSGPGTNLAAGTVGVVFLMDYCGECRSCRLGYTNQCLAKRADMGFTRDGGYGPYELVHQSNFFAAPGVDPGDATLLLDVMGTTRHAISRALAVRPDIESVAIAGAGPIGLGLVALSRLMLGDEVPILISDVVPYRLELAERLGARAVDARNTSLADAAVELRLDGVDAGFDSTGRTVARAGLLAALTARRAALVCIGHGEELHLTISPDLIAPERSILGSEYFRYDELAPNLELLRIHRDYLAQIITHRFPVGDIDEAMATFFAGQTGKVVIEQEG
jgi:threonine dehydrogenase-like Zn-dependent dehydrogenase